MNYDNETVEILKIIKKMNIEKSYSLVRCLLQCEKLNKSFKAKNEKEQKEFCLLLEEYFSFISKFKHIDGLRTIIDNYDLQNIFIHYEKKDFESIKIWITENIIKNKNFKLKKEIYFNNEYSQNTIDNENNILEILNEIIINNNFLYGDIILNIVDKINLNLLFFFDNKRYKNKVVFSYYSLCNLVYYLESYILKIDFTFPRQDGFLFEFMMNMLSNQKNNYNHLCNIIQNSKININKLLRDAEEFLIRYFKQGFFRTKTQYYIKIGMNTNSKFKTFERIPNIDILRQIQTMCKELSDDSILDLYYLSNISDKDLSFSDIKKIDKIAKDIADTNSCAIIISNSMKSNETVLIKDYSNLLIQSAKEFGMNIEQFNILNDVENQYMIKLFEGTIYAEENKKYNIKIFKTKGKIFAYIYYHNLNIFKDRIFTESDAIRIIHFIKYYNEWGK